MWCDCGRPSENVLMGGPCATCNHAARKQARKAARPKTRPDPISKVSGKMAKALGHYSRQKAQWIKGKRCAVYPQHQATDVHHKKGRVGYADQWARENNIPLLLDERFWLPVSRGAHDRIELNPTWARKMGYSETRAEVTG